MLNIHKNWTNSGMLIFLNYMRKGIGSLVWFCKYLNFTLCLSVIVQKYINLSASSTVKLHFIMTIFGRKSR